MGYETEFHGRLTIDPPLNALERQHLNRWAEEEEQFFRLSPEGDALEARKPARGPADEAAGDLHAWLDWLLPTSLVRIGDCADPPPPWADDLSFEHHCRGMLWASGDGAFHWLRVDVDDGVSLYPIVGPQHCPDDLEHTLLSKVGRARELSVAEGLKQLSEGERASALVAMHEISACLPEGEALARWLETRPGYQSEAQKRALERDELQAEEDAERLRLEAIEAEDLRRKLEKEEEKIINRARKAVFVLAVGPTQVVPKHLIEAYVQKTTILGDYHNVVFHFAEEPALMAIRTFNRHLETLPNERAEAIRQELYCNVKNVLLAPTPWWHFGKGHKVSEAHERIRLVLKRGKG